MNPLDFIMHNTVRLTVKQKSGTITATGFTYWVSNPDAPGLGAPTIISNAHVFRDAIEISFHLKHRSSVENPTAPYIQGICLQCVLNECPIIFHPTADLAMFPFETFLRQYDNVFPQNDVGFYYLNSTYIPSSDVISNLNPVEDLLMIGYPKGLWDSVHNLPIFRSGKTASHPAFQYNGENIFLTDLPVFEGSSGSPIFLFNYGNPYFDRKSNKLNYNERLYLLGINSSVHLYPSSSEILIANQKIPFQVPDRMDLGIAIFSSEILVLERMLKDLFDCQSQ